MGHISGENTTKVKEYDCRKLSRLSIWCCRTNKEGTVPTLVELLEWMFKEFSTNGESPEENTGIDVSIHFSNSFDYFQIFIVEMKTQSQMSEEWMEKQIKVMGEETKQLT